MNKKSHYFYLLFFLVLCLAASGCRRDREEPLSKAKPASGADVDHDVAELLDALQMYRFNGIRKAPPFELQSITGETVSLNQYRGKVVLLSFWATW
jgi:cytochrome oxidase Cu insertion factor (SCO1/SenC/PrrC family)